MKKSVIFLEKQAFSSKNVIFKGDLTHYSGQNQEILIQAQPFNATAEIKNANKLFDKIVQHNNRVIQSG